MSKSTAVVCVVNVRVCFIYLCLRKMKYRFFRFVWLLVRTVFQSEDSAYNLSILETRSDISDH